MLIRFTVENFLCFGSAATLSLVASADERHPDHLLDADSGRATLLKAAGIYGANAHGKTKLVQALAFLESLVVEDGYPKTCPFQFSSDLAHKPSRFVIEFRVGTTDYEFGVVLDPERIHEEWLFARYNRREVMLYERVQADRSETASGMKFGPSLKKSKSPTTRFKTIDYLEFLATSLDDKELFLSEASRKGVEVLREPRRWFFEGFQIISADAPYRNLHSRADQDQEFLPFVSSFLREADTGISEIVIQKDRIQKSAIDQMAENVGPQFEEGLANLNSENEMVFASEDGFAMSLQKGADDNFYSILLKARHDTAGGASGEISLDSESSGTRRLIDLLPMLLYDGSDVMTFVIDELDRKLHPLLAYKFLKTFLTCSNIQIVFTTHNTLLLNLELLRRDEIWFVQKRNDQSVDLYSLAEFKVRPDLDIRKGYLNGRFGAIPFVGNLEDLGWAPRSAARKA